MQYFMIHLNQKERSSDMQEIVTIVTNLGFPIAVCIMMAMYIRELTNKHQTETKEFTEALNQNTIVLQKLCDKLDVERTD